jgi:hypothetical protein
MMKQRTREGRHNEKEKRRREAEEEGKTESEREWGVLKRREKQEGRRGR